MVLYALPLFYLRYLYNFDLFLTIRNFFHQVLSQWLVDQAPLGHKAPLPGEDGRRDRLVSCRGLLQTPAQMSSRHAYSYLILNSLALWIGSGMYWRTVWPLRPVELERA